jgi:hypothetical protein
MKFMSRRVSLAPQFLNHVKNAQSKLAVQKQDEHSVVTFCVAVVFVFPKGSFNLFIYKVNLLVL